MNAQCILFSDIGIRKEMITSAYVSLCVIIGLVILVVILLYLRDEKARDSQIAVYLFGLAYRGLCTLSATRNTRWPLETFKDIIESRHDSVRMIELAHQKTYNALDHGHKSGPSLAEQVLFSISQSLTRETESTSRSNETFDSILKTEELFDAFMVHLFKEYCAECLLSIIEFNQFKERLFEANEKDSGTTAFEEEPLEFYKSLTRSHIVYNSGDDYIEIALKLYKKYIRVGSELEINIDFGNRKHYQNLFENNGLNGLSRRELYKIFDPCIDIMITLTMPAFPRFKRGKKYKMIQQHMNVAYEWNKM